MAKFSNCFKACSLTASIGLHPAALASCALTGLFLLSVFIALSMQRLSISMPELERLLLDRLRGSYGCEGIRQVTVIAHERDGDWICGCVVAGNLDPTTWRPALTILEQKYREEYRLANRGAAPKYKVVEIGPNAFWRG